MKKLTGMQYESAAHMNSVWTHYSREYLQLLTCQHPSIILLWIQQCIWSSVRTHHSTEHLPLPICQHAALLLIWTQQCTYSTEHVLLVTCQDVLLLIYVILIKQVWNVLCVSSTTITLNKCTCYEHVHRLSLRHMISRNKNLCIPKFVLQKGNWASPKHFCPSLLTVILYCLKSHVRSAFW